jgi:hypothetical protein
LFKIFSDNFNKNLFINRQRRKCDFFDKPSEKYLPPFPPKSARKIASVITKAFYHSCIKVRVCVKEREGGRECEKGKGDSRQERERERACVLKLRLHNESAMRREEGQEKSEREGRETR